MMAYEDWFAPGGGMTKVRGFISQRAATAISAILKHQDERETPGLRLPQPRLVQAGHAEQGVAEVHVPARDLKFDMRRFAVGLCVGGA